jgi:uncharacterized protein (DUF1684 family)
MIPYHQWQAERLAALTAPDGWLNLTDRVEFGPGRHMVGAAEDCELRLSCGPDRLGWLTSGGGPTFSFETADGRLIPFTTDGQNPPRASVAPFLLEIHTVNSVTALRTRWTAGQRGKHFEGIRSYPFDPAWVIAAQWENLAQPMPLQVDMVSGTTETVLQTHVARFHHDGHDVNLVPTHVKSGKPMFVIRDATSGKETYGASRFLIAEPNGNQIILDFNTAHTPPCGFTDLAICPLPPPQNRLPFAVRAGELKP